MITHDVAEAISMADRVIVLSDRPAKVKKIYTIDMEDKGNPTHNRNLKEFRFFYKKIRKILVIFTQILLAVLLISIWELLATYKVINTFITSSPSRVLSTIISLYNDNNLFNNIWTTIYETLISFSLGTIIGIITATILWYFNFIYKVLDPYLTILNSLPKIALGPIIIIFFGANINSIIIMALLISVIVTVITVYNGFISTDKNRINLLKSFSATKGQIFKYVILPSSYSTIISSLKINISMTLIGVIMGEFLVSKSGIGYLINYGSQVFNLNLVISGIIILMIVSYLMYIIVSYIEKILVKND